MREPLPSVTLCAVFVAAGIVVSSVSVVSASAGGDAGPQSATGVLAASRLGADPQTKSLPRAAETSQQVTFYWGLKRNDGQAARLARKVSDPQNGQYRGFLKPKRIAAQFGATAKTVAEVKKYLTSKDLTGRLDKSRIFMRVSGTAAQFQAAFGQPIVSEDSGGFVAYAPNNNPTLPKRIRRLVPQMIWLGQQQIPGAQGVQRRAEPHPTTRQGPPSDKGTLTGCPALKSAPFAPYTMTVAQAAKAYGMTPLQSRNAVAARGDIASRPPIGVLALGSGFSDSYLAAATNCYGVSGSAYRIKTDGMSGPLPSALPSGISEGDLDVQMVLAGLASNYRIPVYESSSFPTSYLLAPVAALNSPAVPEVLTISYGTCEIETAKSTRELADAVFMRLALVGTSVLSAAGDSGSSGCVSLGTGLGPRQLAVNYPASSPWATSVGGTRIVLTETNKRAAEYVWNDSPWGSLGAGGGGKSSVYGRPVWQPKAMTRSTKRTVPDLSAHASTLPGFPLVGLGQPAAFAEPIEGTSAATPLTATGIALLNVKLGSRGRPPLGFLNPWLYQLPKAATFDIRQTNNDLYNQGCCSAKRGYDRASGIGSPNFESMWKHVKRVN